MPLTKNYRIAAAAAAATLSIILTGATHSCGGQEDGGSVGSGEVLPPQQQEPPAKPKDPAEPKLPPLASSCPAGWPIQHEYGAPGTRFYELDQDYGAIFDGFSICQSGATNEYVLYNNGNQVWSIAPNMEWRYAVNPSPTSETSFFRSHLGGQRGYTYVVPGEIVTPTKWPDQIAWAPDPDLTSGWVSQKLALENLELSAESGNLDESVDEFVRNRQLNAATPLGAALLGCVKSGHEVATEAVDITNETEFADRLKLTLGGTKGVASCAGSLQELYKDPAQGSRDWLKHVERSSGVASQGIDTVQAFRPIMAACGILDIIPKVSSLSRFCP